MKIEKKSAHFNIHFSRREAMILRHVLSLYPLLNPDYHRLSQKPDPRIGPGQKMLEDAMSEQHRRIKSEISAMMEPLQEKHPGQISLRLDGGQLERFLRALNDVRVGSWVRLGKPDIENRAALQMDENNAPFFQVMEVSGYFEMEILEALRR